MSRESNIPAALGSLFILGFPLGWLRPSRDQRRQRPSGGDHPCLSIGRFLDHARLVPLDECARYARPDAVGAPDVRSGWPNRVSILAYLAWVALVAVTTLMWS
jgi:hypothetical protein